MKDQDAARWGDLSGGHTDRYEPSVSRQNGEPKARREEMPAYRLGLLGEYFVHPMGDDGGENGEGESSVDI